MDLLVFLAASVPNKILILSDIVLSSLHRQDNAAMRAVAAITAATCQCCATGRRNGYWIRGISYMTEGLRLYTTVKMRALLASNHARGQQALDAGQLASLSRALACTAHFSTRICDFPSRRCLENVRVVFLGRIACTECKNAAYCCRCSVVCMCACWT